MGRWSATVGGASGLLPSFFSLGASSFLGAFLLSGFAFSFKKF